MNPYTWTETHVCENSPENSTNTLGKGKHAQGDADDDEENNPEDEESDENLLSELSRSYHELLKTHETHFYPYFEQLLPTLQAFMVHSNPACRQFAICAFDDLIEFTGPACVVYQSLFIDVMISSLLDPAHEVRQAAAYGVGIAAQFGGDPFVGHCASKYAVVDSFCSVSPC